MAIRLVNEGFMKTKHAEVTLTESSSSSEWSNGSDRINVSSNFEFNKLEYTRINTTSQGKRRPVSFRYKRLWRPMSGYGNPGDYPRETKRNKKTA